ncbi:U-box domain-containing protein 33-like [Triticum dicoccoides]|uniref:RING-type E3 ubiquitin transferase n=2 Tax=Triticum aestivum TaxID=4565 RepID=A0A3B6PMV7_WHEAT|nr:U-box domain-containing protein 33-like [Triticum dicoccoides]XP_044413489.1 U-box domain-containing protein 33-like isoform X1 [Triticum aestivum]
MEAHRRWDTSGSGSRYSFRTSVSSLADIGGEIVEVDQAGGELEAADRVFVAVPGEVKHGKSALQWALQNLAKDGAQVVVAHVHRPAQMIPMMGAKMHHTRLDPEQVKDYRKQELEKALERLEEYVVLCTMLKDSCEKIIIEKDDVAKGLEELIVLHGITKLVMGAAADKHYSKKMKRPKSKTAIILMEAEASPCKIWFTTCKGQLICTREANTTVPMIPPSPASTVASTLSASSLSSHMRSITIHQSESEAPSSNGSPQQNLNRSRTEVMRHHSRGAGGTAPQLFEPFELNVNTRPTRTPLSSMDSWGEFGRRSQSSWYNLSRNDDAISVSESATHHPMHESDDDHFSSPFHELENPGADAEMYGRLEEALRETQESKKEVFEESTKRRKAELDLLSALQKAKELEKLYHHEIRQRKTIEETLVRQAQELEATEIQCDTIYDQLHDAEEQKAVLEQRMTEMESALRDGEEKLASSKCLLEALQADKEKLQQESDAAAAAAEELRQKSEQRISMATEALNTKFSAVELEQATRSFDEALKIGEGGFGCVYKGSLRSTTVAIKLLHPKSLQGQSEFNQEVAVLGRVRHPNLVALIGSCREAFGLVYEYLPNGSLEDRLACANDTPPLTWQVRTRIIYEMCSALTFLHSNKPHPVVHGDLKPANILLDANLVSKLGDFGICRLLTQSGTSTAATTLYRTTTPRGTFAYMDPEFLSSGELTPRSDVYSLGIIILQLLTGRRPQKIAEVVEDAVEKGELHTVLDPSAGAWPFVQANQLAHLGLRCAEMSRRRRPDLAREVWTVVEPLMKAASLTARRPMFAASPTLPDEASTPSYFVCPIFQEMMNDPHIAADGFTYEAEAIRGWLDSGHDTSPMTNLKLAHRELTPNRGLRSVILEWQQQHRQRYQYHEDWR